MVFEHIEKLKRAFTDKYVVVDATRPELARFKDATGLIKTVNMNGRALVEFDQFDNIGWYDIELDFLKVVPQPDPKAAEKPAAEKPAAAAKPAAKPAARKTACRGGRETEHGRYLGGRSHEKRDGRTPCAGESCPSGSQAGAGGCAKTCAGRGNETYDGRHSRRRARNRRRSAGGRADDQKSRRAGAGYRRRSNRAGRGSRPDRRTRSQTGESSASRPQTDNHRRKNRILPSGRREGVM